MKWWWKLRRWTSRQDRTSVGYVVLSCPSAVSIPESYRPWWLRYLSSQTLRFLLSVQSWWTGLWNNKTPVGMKTYQCNSVHETFLLCFPTSHRHVFYIKTLTALIPDNCCDNCITTPITNGALNVGLHMSSVIEMEDSDCWARSSALISSMSSSTWLLALSLRNAFLASSSHCFVISKYLQRDKKIISKFRWQKKYEFNPSIFYAPGRFWTKRQQY